MKPAIRKLFSATLAFLALTVAPSPSQAQEIIEIEPLFEYPVAPEEMESMTDKSNYLVEHFWDALDLKSMGVVDQNALNHAFMVFSTPMRFADKEKTLQAVDKLLERIGKNPVLTIQFAKAAEEALYGPRSEVWIDEVYLRFLQALEKNKKVPAARKARYMQQLGSLSKSSAGMTAPLFSFTDAEGGKHGYFPMSTPTVIVFCDPTVADWRMWRMTLETNIPFMTAVEKGKVNVMFIVPQESGNWKEEVASYPKSWTVGIAPDIKSTYDIRLTPTVYVIDSKGKIADKNVNPARAVEELLEFVN